LAYKPGLDKNVNSTESERILSTWIDSTSNPILLKHLLEQQGPKTDEKIKTIQV